MELVEHVPGAQAKQADGRIPAIADYVDRLVTVEMRNRGMPGGKIAPLYDAARAEGGGQPLALRAAAGLIANAGRGSNVLIVTGAGSGPLIPYGENDGPVGAAVLARALHRGLGCTPVLVCEEHHGGPIAASCEAIGVGVRTLEHATTLKVGGAVVTAPVRQEEIDDWARDLLDRLQPTAIVAIERLGPNSKGIVHGATGIAGWDPLVDLAPLFAAAADRGIFSVGIGDAGNEIGFGRIADDVRRIQPHGAVCRCECGAGMATVVPTDVLVVAAVSNWGAYGIEACLATLLERPDLQHTPEEAERVILRCLHAGGLEAMFCTQRFFVDGIAGEISVSIVQLLREMVRIHLEVPDAGVIH
ncbi:MAG TPA: glutamate cyclase domain-containing protein [Terriglobales bacterium]|nr:glutamate cyclase domain-containing protein [Terriglobales bacterium]